jgi:hypothetical protein
VIVNNQDPNQFLVHDTPTRPRAVPHPQTDVHLKTLAVEGEIG